jgi:hypothetical protein
MRGRDDHWRPWIDVAAIELLLRVQTTVTKQSMCATSGGHIGGEQPISILILFLSKGLA